MRNLFIAILFIFCFVSIGHSATKWWEDVPGGAATTVAPTDRLLIEQGLQSKTATKADIVLGLATDADLTAHEGDVANPHSVTKTQVGLGYVENIKVNLTAVINPPVTADSSIDYSIGSKWYNISSDKIFECIDASVGAAVWKEITVQQLSSVEVKTLYELNNDTNAFTDAEKTKLTNLPALTADQIAALNNATAPTALNPYATNADVSAASGADMLKSVYDPTNISASAFDMDNMVAGTNNKILSADEKAAIPVTASAAIPLIISNDSRLTNARTPLSHGNTSHDVAYVSTESDPVYSAWDKSTGISITESQVSDLSHTVDTFVTNKDAHDHNGGDGAAIPDAGLASGATVISAGAADSGKLVKLDAAGHVDATTINDADITVTESQISDFGTYEPADATIVKESELAGLETDPTLPAHTALPNAHYPHGTAAGKNIPATGNASATEVVYGTDTRLTDARTPTAHDQAWSTITTTPTTLSGYGITDAATSTQGALADSALQVEVDGSTTNELQDLSLVTNTLSLSDSIPTVDLSPYLDNTDDQTASEMAVTTTAFAGMFANDISHNTPQELFDIIDDYAPAWTDITSIPAGFADGIDSTGLPVMYKFLNADYGNDLAAAITAIGSTPTVLYADASIASLTGTHVLPATIMLEFLPGVVWTDGGVVDVTINNLRALSTQQIFEGFAADGELTIGLNTKDVFLEWFGIENDGTSDDQLEIDAMFLSAQTGHNLWFPVLGNLKANSLTTTNKAVKVFLRGSNIITGTSNGFLNVTASEKEVDFGQSIAITAKENSFTIPAAVTTLAEGDTVLLESTDIWHTPASIDYKHAVLGQVVDITGATATLDVFAPYSFTAQTIKVLNTVDGFLLDGADVDLSAATGANQSTYAFYGNYLLNTTIQNSVAKGSDDAWLGFFVRGINTKVSGSKATNFWNALGQDGISAGRGGYCFNIQGTNSLISENIAIDCKHLYSNSTTSTDDYNIVMENNIGYQSDIAAGTIALGGATDGLYWGNPAFDTHAAAYDVTIRNNFVSSASYAMVNHRGYQMRLENNTFIQRAAAPNLVVSGYEYIDGAGDALEGPIYMTNNAFESVESGMVLMPATQEANGFIVNNNMSGIARNKPTCTATTKGKDWYTDQTVATKETCMQTGASTYAWTSNVLPTGTTSQLLVNTGSAWTAATPHANSEVSTTYTAGQLYLDIKADIIKESMLNVSNAPVSGYSLTANPGTGGFTWVDVAGGGGGLTDPMTTRGDIIIRNASNVSDRLAVGTTGQVLGTDGTDVSWVSAGSGDVTKVGTPVDNQVGVWTGSGTIEGTTGLVYDDTTKGLKITSTGFDPARGLVLYQHNTTAAGGNIVAYKSNSADDTPGAGDAITGVANLNTYLAYGWDGNSYELAGGLYLQSEAAFTDGVPTGAFKVYLDNGTAYNSRMELSSAGTLKLPVLAATYTGGSAYVCVNNAGELFVSESACP